MSDPPSIVDKKIQRIPVCHGLAIRVISEKKVCGRGILLGGSWVKR